MTFRLHSRLVVWNLLIIGLISSILGFFLSSSLRDHMEAQIEKQLRDQANLAAVYLESANEEKPLDDVVDDLSRMLDVRVSLIRSNGTVAADSHLDDPELQAIENQSSRPEIRQALQEGTGSSFGWNAAERANYAYVSRRIDGYVLRLAAPLSEALVSELRAQLTFAMTIAIGLTVVFGYLVRGLISHPLREISAGAKRLAAGDLQERLPITGDEEIAALGTSLNAMARNLSTKVRELSDGKQRLELILGAMGEGVMVLDSSGRVVLTNESMHEILGTEWALSGKTPLEIFRNPALDTAVRHALGGGSSEVIELTTSAGRVLEANVAPVRNIAGIVESVVIGFHDLTDIRRIERMRRDFVANVSHEFKTPLTSIRGYAETLLSGAREDPKIATDFLKIIERNARYLEALVSDLLTLARLESEVPASKESVDVRSVIDELILARQASVAELGVLVTVDCPSVEIQADRFRLATAVSNLIDNAVHYNRTDGEIRISGNLDNGTFHLRITDTGRGIPSDELPRIFERFYRVDKARSRASGGTGLGLSIVKHAIESQGGTLSVASRVGSGSTFTIHLPAGPGSLS